MSQSGSVARVSTSVARKSLGKTLRRAARGSRIVVQNRGRDVAAVVSIDDLRLIEDAEDRLDVEAARAAIDEMKRTGERPMPYEKVRKELGLA